MPKKDLNVRGHKKDVHPNPASASKAMTITALAKQKDPFEKLPDAAIHMIAKKLSNKDMHSLAAASRSADRVLSKKLVDAKEHEEHLNNRFRRFLRESTMALPEVHDLMAEIAENEGHIQTLKKGGLVKKTGLAKVHKGELVVPAHRVKAVSKAVKEAGLKPLRK